MFQRLFPRETLDRRDHKRTLPATHAASMKLSKTFFGPDLLELDVELVAATARMRPNRTSGGRPAADAVRSTLSPSTARRSFERLARASACAGWTGRPRLS